MSISDIPLAEQIATLKEVIEDFRETDLCGEYIAGLMAAVATLERLEREVK